MRLSPTNRGKRKSKTNELRKYVGTVDLENSFPSGHTLFVSRPVAGGALNLHQVRW